MRVALACLLVAAVPDSARADAPETGGASDSTSADAPPDRNHADPAVADPASPDALLPDHERREVPNYAGRPPPQGTDAADVALWIPRTIFSPFYLVTEYVIRQPLNWLFTEIERIHALRWLINLLTFGPNREAGITPSAFFDFGFRPSVGLYAYWNHFLIRQNRIGVHLATGGPNWYMLDVSDVMYPNPFMIFRFHFNATERSDQVFGGIGWNATQTVRSRYQIRSIDASVVAGIRPWRRTAIDYEVGFRTASFSPYSIFGDPGVGQRGTTPPAFNTGYNAFRAGVSAVFDTHPSIAPLSTGGVIARAFVTHNTGFGGLPTLSRWLNWGGTLMFSTDVLGHGRVLSLRGDTAFISPFNRNNPNVVVPFTELLDVGGNGPLRGFWPGWIRGYSMLAVSLIYVWPIWAFLDAHIRVSVGNAFGQYMEDFRFDRLRMSFDIGMEPRFGGQHPFELLFGMGTQTFSAGMQVTAIRFAIGTRTGI